MGLIVGVGLLLSLGCLCSDSESTCSAIRTVSSNTARYMLDIKAALLSDDITYPKAHLLVQYVIDDLQQGLLAPGVFYHTMLDCYRSDSAKGVVKQVIEEFIYKICTEDIVVQVQYDPKLFISPEGTPQETIVINGISVDVHILSGPARYVFKGEMKSISRTKQIPFEITVTFTRPAYNNVMDIHCELQRKQERAFGVAAAIAVNSLGKDIQAVYRQICIDIINAKQRSFQRRCFFLPW